MANKDSVVVKGVELRWAFLAKPHTEGDYASGKYQVDIVVDEKQKAILEQLPRSNKQGFKKLEGDDAGKWSIALKSTVKPRVVDKDCMPMSDEDVAKIGNGTIANMRVVGFDARGSSFIGLGDIRIVSLVEYAGANWSDLLDDDEVADSLAVDDDDDLA